MVRFDPEGDSVRPWVVECVHTYEYGPIKLCVPAGFRTDFTSHPRWLATALLFASLSLIVWPQLVWGLFPTALFALCIRDPLGKHQRAALFHDAGYAEQTVPRYMVDTAYRMIMDADGVNPLRVYLHYYAVRMFGWIAWRQNYRRYHAKNS